MSERSEIKGPLGIWPFPLINAFLMIIIAVKSGVKGEKRQKLYEFVRDERGRIIQILEYEV